MKRRRFFTVTMGALVLGGLLVAALLILAWVIVPAFRRRYTFNVPSYSRAESIATPAAFKPGVVSASAQKNSVHGNGFVGGPRQVSLQLKASKPSLRHSAIPSGNLSDDFDLTKGLRATPARDSAYTKSSLHSAPAAWARSIWPNMSCSAGPARSS